MDLTRSVTILPGFLKLLAHELRWKILTQLARSDYSVAEIVQFLDQPQNVVSYHLKKLRDQRLVTERRSSADGRDVYYSLDLETFRSLYLAAGETLHPALGQAGTATLPTLEGHLRKPLRVLFLCTENSARSQIAEALLRHMSQGQIDVSSAGSHPTGIHPFALRVLSLHGIETNVLHSKHFNEFVSQSFDYIITVCDRVREACPGWPDNSERIHWSVADPAMGEGTEEERLGMFEQTFLQISVRIRYLLTLIEREQAA